MEGEPPAKASTSPGAVFLSYASEDAAAAGRICEALRAAGIEVWFDQTELRGGDAWDQSIRRQIKNCALFIPVISRHTHARAEGYFRLEWKLAVDRSHLIMANKAFLLPVVVDDTTDRDEHVPEKFHEVQWTRLPDGETPPGFVARVERLLSNAGPAAVRAGAPPAASAASWSRRASIVVAVRFSRWRWWLFWLSTGRGAQTAARRHRLRLVRPRPLPRRRTQSRYCRSSI